LEYISPVQVIQCHRPNWEEKRERVSLTFFKMLEPEPSQIRRALLVWICGAAIGKNLFDGLSLKKLHFLLQLIECRPFLPI
jgi:hypothetical protein